MLALRFSMRPLFLFALSVIAEGQCAHAESLMKSVVQATYRLETSQTSGTGFIVRQPDIEIEGDWKLLLVTAAHTFEKMDGDKATFVLRKQDESRSWIAQPTTLQIRKEGKPLWQQHPKQDVAVLLLPKDINANSVPLAALSDAKDWKKNPPEPGSLVRMVGFPHAAQFKPNKAGFPLTRLGCIASFPLTPVEQHPTFLVDYNTFEGDSGGPVYIEHSNDQKTVLKIIGLVHGQHFLDERYETIYQKGHVRKRLGLAIIVNSQFILETIDSFESEDAP